MTITSFRYLQADSYGGCDRLPAGKAILSGYHKKECFSRFLEIFEKAVDKSVSIE